MKKIIPIVMTLLLAFVLSSCSKEKRVAKTLYRKDGLWTIETYKVTTTEDGVNQGTIDLMALGLTGTMDFAEGGALAFTFSFLGQTETEIGIWSNTSDKITITTDGETLVYDIIERSKKELELKATDTYSSGGSTVTDVLEITLTR